MKKSFKMTGLGCAHCGTKIEREIAKLPGVNEVHVSFMTQRLTLDTRDESFESIVASAKQIAARIEPGCTF